MDWYSVHVSYYEEDKDALLLEGVRPLFRRLAPRVDALAFARHWRFGPHLRLNVATDAATFAHVVRPAAEEVLGDFLTRKPSRRRLDPGQELATHRRLAVLENVQGPLLPWYPDNSLRTAPCDVGTGGPPSVRHTVELAERFGSDTAELAFAVIGAARGAARLAVGFDLMLATAYALTGGDIDRARVGFRSHAERFLCGFPEGPALRPRWERHWAASAPALTARLHRVASAVEHRSPRPPFVREWALAVERLRDAALSLVATGAVTPPSEPLDAARIAEVSPFHRRLYADERWRAVRSSPAAFAYRVAVNCTYQFMTKIGTAPVERFLLCHLAAHAIERCHGGTDAQPAAGEADTPPAAPPDTGTDTGTGTW